MKWGLRIVSAVVGILMMVLAAAGPAAAEDDKRYAAIVVDLDTGEVMHARHADDLRYPASLTKIMTLYMLFDALKAGEIGLHDQMPVSQHAAAQPPSKFYLKPGETIEVEDAIYALVTKSANDVAAVIGERLGGTEEKFGRMMTARAKELGMTRTRFRNASGLPDNEQVTTARDMYTLAVAMMEDHPEYYDYFETEDFTYDGRTYGNHNNLLGRVEGVDGIKTGYTRASGFNLTLSAERDGRRIVAVVMGGSTARVRDAHMEDLVTRAFASIESGKDDPTLLAEGESTAAESGFVLASNDGAAEPQLAGEPPVEQDEQEIALAANELRQPAMQGDAGGEKRGVQIVFSDDAGEPTEAEAAEPETGKSEPEPVRVAMPEPEPAAAPIEKRAASAARAAPSEILSEPVKVAMDAPASAESAEQETSEPVKLASVAPAKPAPSAAGEPAKEMPDVFKGGWAIQVGAFGTKEKANAHLAEIQGLSLNGLESAMARIEPMSDGGKEVYRARFSGLSQIAAARLCQDLTARGDGCFPVSPTSLQ